MDNTVGKQHARRYRRVPWSPHAWGQALYLASGIPVQVIGGLFLSALIRWTQVMDPRGFARLGLLSGRERYDGIQRWFMERLPDDAELFGDYHAQIVRVGKEFCRARPSCGQCPLDDLCPKRGVTRGDGTGLGGQ